MTMTSLPRIQLLSAALCLVLCTAADAGQPAAPETWLFPPTNSADPGQGDVRLLGELFAKPEQWQGSRSKLHVLGIADWQFAKVSDQELRRWLDKINAWKLKLALETRCLDHLAVDAQHALARIETTIARLHSLGGHLDYLILAGTRENAQRLLNRDQDFAVEECATLLANLNRRYPDLKVGDCERYPAAGADLAAWVSAVEAKAKEKKTRGLDFLQVQVDSPALLFSAERAEYSWPKVKTIEEAVHAQQVLFGMRYTPADVVHLDPKYNPRDLAWYIALMRQGYDYFYVRGNPDQLVIASWESAPVRAVPETEDGTLTKALDDLFETFCWLGGVPIWVKSK